MTESRQEGEHPGTGRHPRIWCYIGLHWPESVVRHIELDEVVFIQRCRCGRIRLEGGRGWAPVWKKSYLRKIARRRRRNR